jgi:hypothetical protein
MHDIRSRTGRIPGGLRNPYGDQFRVAGEIVESHRDADGRCGSCDTAWPCKSWASAGLILAALSVPAADVEPQVWWPDRPDAPIGRVWTVPLSTWPLLWADLDTVLDAQMRAWRLPEVSPGRRRAVDHAAARLAQEIPSDGMALAMVRSESDGRTTGAGVWLLPSAALPSIHRADDLITRLHRAWAGGRPVAGNPPRLPLAGPEPRRRLSAPVPAPTPTS